MFTIYMPHQNLNCFGCRVMNPLKDTQILYFDIRIDEQRPILYINIGLAKYTIGFWFIRKWH